MTKQKVLLFVLPLLFFILGVTLSEKIKKIVRNEPLKRGYSPIGTNADEGLQLAHGYSANFRQLFNYCSGVAINPREQGYFRMSYTTAENIVNAMAAIKTKATPIIVDSFNCIFGSKSTNTNEKSTIMVVGIDNKGDELTYYGANQPLIYEVNYSLPCPRFCDITKALSLCMEEMHVTKIIKFLS